jgi:hypothetical protein
MLDRLINLIEIHSQDLTSHLVDRVHDSFVTPAYQHVPPEELRRAVYEIYCHLGNWLSTKDELDLERRYLHIGADRARQNVPFSQVAWVIILVKVNLWEFLEKHAAEERLLDTLGELRAFQLIDHFFDHAIYYAAVGYELPWSDDKKAA